MRILEVARVENLTRFKRKMAIKRAKAMRDSNLSVKIGYEASYALWVHENIEEKWKGLPRKHPHKGRYWDPQGRGRSKFLEYPARVFGSKIGSIIGQAAKNGATLLQSMLLGGMFLQRESQRIVPVDTGNLKASAFTKAEK